MAAVIRGLFGDSKPAAAPVKASDSDFADFAEAPEPTPPSINAIPNTPSFTGASASATGAAVPYTKWYNVHERHSISEFKAEGIFIILILILVGIHLWGAKANRSKAKKWIKAHAPALQKEFSMVGFGNKPLTGEETGNALFENPDIKLMKETSLNEFRTYATGRTNVAFIDASIVLFKRYNPLTLLGDYVLSFFFDSVAVPVEKMKASIYTFDGKEQQTVPGLQVPGAHELRNKDSKSTYDGFVWAVVNKDEMKVLRDERYDVSITTTKDNPKLPIWATVMTEAAEITDMLLTPELVKAVEQAGDLMDYIVVSDQPIDKPTTIDETTARKRVFMSMKLPNSEADYAKTLPLFEYFLRFPDILVQQAHLRPEVMRKVRATREDQIRRLQKADEEEKAEERALEREKAKKQKRELELKGLDAKAQKKYLEKEKEKEMRRSQKKMSVKG